MGRSKSAQIPTREPAFRAVRARNGSTVRGSSATEKTAGQIVGLRERKKARLRQQIIETAIKLFRKHGYENTRIDDIVQLLEISQPTFFRYFPSKDAVLAEVGRRGYSCMKEHLEAELSSGTAIAGRLRHMYMSMAREVESDQPLWRAVVLSGAMDPVRSPEIRKHRECATGLLRELLRDGQKQGEITRAFSVDYLTEFMEGLYASVVRRWAVGLTGSHSLTDYVSGAVEFFLSGARP